MWRSYSIVANDWHMSSGGFRSESLSIEVETTIEVLRLATHKPRHYLYAVLAVAVVCPALLKDTNIRNLF